MAKKNPLHNLIASRLERQNELPLGKQTVLIKNAKFDKSKQKKEMLVLGVESTSPDKDGEIHTEIMRMPIETLGFKIAQLMRQLGIEETSSPDVFVDKTATVWKYQVEGEFYSSFAEPADWDATMEEEFA